MVFDLIESKELDDFQETRNDSYNKLESKLRAHKASMKSGTSRVFIYPVTFLVPTTRALLITPMFRNNADLAQGANRDYSQFGPRISRRLGTLVFRCRKWQEA
uniref:Uncharacterized protein n=1 Tax=Candidatus Kentrum sp. SD TaxID=2126332 RepID=A0A451BPM1_9GAMM|nr:MAG: hypothetical protein BECKSD772D_GA0070982_10976 [Candidatus Kentron sp. SD]